MKKALKISIISFISLAFFLVLVFGAIQLYMLKGFDHLIFTADEVPECDAVLVLGARAYESGPSPTLQDRLDYALDLYFSGKAPKILASGDHGTTEYDEVNTMLEYLLEHGVPREDIFLDHAGFNTYDSVYRAKAIFCCESIIISTQEFHMPRALYMAKRMGLEAYGVPCPDKGIYNMAYNNIRESLARVKAVIETDITKRLPRYLGEKLPITGDGSVTNG